MQTRALPLSAAEQQELERAPNRDPRLYLRERAAALLKIAGGMAPFAVARGGLPKPRAPDTIYIRLNDYEKNRALHPQPARRRRLFAPDGSKKPRA